MEWMDWQLGWRNKSGACNARHPPNQEIENSVIPVRLKQPLGVEKNIKS